MMECRLAEWWGYHTNTQYVFYDEMPILLKNKNFSYNEIVK